MEIRKEIIRPGTYTYIHPKTGKPERLTVTADTIKHFATQGAAMLAAGLSIPVPVEHQPDAKPMTESEMAAHHLRNNAGWVKNYEIGEVKEKGPDGKDRTVKDVFFGKLDIRDPEIARKLPTGTINFTSPWINSFTDGTGRKWDGVVSHVALTTRPRITQQQPFAADMAAALSLIGGLSDRQLSPSSVTEGFGLSEAGLMDGSGTELKPHFSCAFSLLTGVKLSGEDASGHVHGEHGKFASKGQAGPVRKKRKKKKKAADDEVDRRIAERMKEGEAIDRNVARNEGRLAIDDDELADDEEWDDDEGTERGSPLDDVGDVGPADVSIHETIGHLLKALGFNPPDGMDESTFERDLYETLMAKVQELGATAAQGEADKMNEPKEDAMNPKKDCGTNPVIQESPAMYASIAEVQKVTDPQQRKFAEAMFSLHQTNKRNEAVANAARKNILDGAARERQAKLENVSKRLPVTKRDELLRMISAPDAAMSLSDDGKVKDPMQAMLDLLDESLPSLTGDVSATLGVQPHPEDGTLTDERRKEVVDTVLANTGGVARPKVA